MFLRYTLSRITKILKNPLTVFWFKNKTFLLSGMLKSLFFFFPFNSIFQSQFFIFAFLFYLSDPTSIYIFPHTATPRQPHESFIYIHTYGFIPLKGKTNKSLPIQSLISSQMATSHSFPPSLYSTIAE